MVIFPNAKINFGLYVTGKRPDGYHNIQSILYPIPLKDALEVIRSKDGKFRFTLSGISVEGDDEKNLVVKAWQLLHRDFDLPPVQMHLHKSIPMGAGLGGGSADAAFLLKHLNLHFQLDLSTQQLQAYAAKLGMDCPFFIENMPAYTTERGDRLAKIDVSLSGKFLVLVKPDCHVSTGAAYAEIQPAAPPIDLKGAVNQPIEYWNGLIKNNFEKTVFNLCPKILAIKSDLYKYGAKFALMSGSGSSVYGIFDEEVRLKDYFPHDFYFGCWI